MAFSSPHRPELWKCFTPLILSVLVFVTRNFTDTNTSNFAISSNFYKKGWNYAWTKDWDLLLLGWLRKGFITHSFCKWPFYTLQSAKPMWLARIRKRWKSVNLGKTQCWALFVISKATFTKTAIKPKFDDRFSLKISVIQCTIKCPIFMFIVTF